MLCHSVGICYVNVVLSFVNVFSFANKALCVCVSDLPSNTNYKFRVQLASRPRDKVVPSWPGPATANWTRTPCAGNADVYLSLFTYDSLLIYKFWWSNICRNLGWLFIFVASLMLILRIICFLTWCHTEVSQLLTVTLTPMPTGLFVWLRHRSWILWHVVVDRAATMDWTCSGVRYSHLLWETVSKGQNVWSTIQNGAMLHQSNQI